MTNKEFRNRVAKLTEELALVEGLTKDECKKDLENASFNDILDELWEFYCYVSDIKSALMDVKSLDK